MYVDPNCKTKKELKERLAKGEKVAVFNPGPWPCPSDGRVGVEGPHFPKPHSWYASVLVKDGLVVKVLS